MLAGPTPAVMPLRATSSRGRWRPWVTRLQGSRRARRVVVDPLAADNIGNGGPEGAFTPQLLVRNARLGVKRARGARRHALRARGARGAAAVAMHAVNIARTACARQGRSLRARAASASAPWWPCATRSVREIAVRGLLPTSGCAAPACWVPPLTLNPARRRRGGGPRARRTASGRGLRHAPWCQRRLPSRRPGPRRLLSRRIVRIPRRSARASWS